MPIGWVRVCLLIRWRFVCGHFFELSSSSSSSCCVVLLLLLLLLLFENRSLQKRKETERDQVK